STPATLTPTGYLQFETGVLGAEHSGEFANRTGLNEVIKLAASSRLQFLVSAEPFVVSDVGRSTERGPGGVALGAQAVLLPGRERRPTIAVSYFRSIYGGTAPDLDIGSSLNSGLVLVSFDVCKLHVDTNYIFNEEVQNAVHRVQYGQTLSLARPLHERMAFTGEIWHFTQPFLQADDVGLLLAPTYALKPNLVLDAGFQRGLTVTSTRWEIFAGFTYLMPKKLW
ncbi:MAG: hypothetical protein ACRD4I_00775, partial [Candidatus Angelobacter sp.]